MVEFGLQGVCVVLTILEGGVLEDVDPAADRVTALRLFDVEDRGFPLVARHGGAGHCVGHAGGVLSDVNVSNDS